MAKCCLCGKIIEREDAAVLSMGAAGNPRLLCDECEALLDTATLGKDYEDIKAAIEQIGAHMLERDPDGVTYSMVNEIMVSATERAKAIKDGSYDFSLDDQPKDDGGLDDIPEELLESDEDKELDKVDDEKMKKFDKVYNFVLIGACVAYAIFLVWKIVDSFFL